MCSHQMIALQPSISLQNPVCSFVYCQLLKLTFLGSAFCRSFQRAKHGGFFSARRVAFRDKNGQGCPTRLSTLQYE